MSTDTTESLDQPEAPTGDAESTTETATSEPAEEGFKKFDLSEEVQRAIEEMGYEQPMPVQAASYGPIRSGKDLLVRSKTGTGKTAAFAIPLVEMVKPGQREPQVLVLTPTRELAAQVAEEFTSLAKYKDTSCQPIYGGASMQNQLSAIRSGVEFVVGTPGRILDHLRRGSLDFSKIRVCVLDEADEMLSMGFFEEVSRILDALPESRQVLLYSASLPHDIERLVQKYTKDPERLELSGDDLTVEGIHNILYFTNETLPKPRNLLYVLAVENPQNAIVFCNTREDTTYVGAYLRREGFDAEVINGDLPQSAREQVMGKVKGGNLRFLVATDIAARGIDISDLSHVFNYSLPEAPEVYLHRVGRTGRVGKKGVAISLLEGREITTLRQIKRMYRVAFEERKLPTSEEYRGLVDRRRLSQLAADAATADTSRYSALAERVIANEEATHLVAFLLKAWEEATKPRRPSAEQRTESAPEGASKEGSRDEGKDGGRRGRGGGRDSDERRGRDGDERRGRDGDERGEARGGRRRSRDGASSSRGRGGSDSSRGRSSGEGSRGRSSSDGGRGANGSERPRAADASRARGISPYARELIPEGWEAVPASESEPVAPPEAPPEAPPKRSPRSSSSDRDPTTVKIHLNVGYADGFREAQISEVIAEIAQIPAVDISRVTPHRRYSFFCVPENLAEQVLTQVHNIEYEGKALNAERARERGR